MKFPFKTPVGDKKIAIDPQPCASASDSLIDNLMHVWHILRIEAKANLKNTEKFTMCASVQPVCTCPNSKDF